MYKVFVEEIKVEDVSVNSYGIACVEDNIVSAYVSDISPNKILVEDIADLFNQSDLAPEHLSDVVEDIINDPSFPE